MSIISNAPWLRFAVTCGLLAGGLTYSTARPAAAAPCTSGVVGDVNGDGYAEVAVSEGGRSYGEGAVHVFYGRPKGLAAGASGKALDDQYLEQDTPGVPGEGRDHELFGSTTAFGDFNDDGCADLAVGQSDDPVAGTVYIFYGSKSGLKISGAKVFTSADVFGGPINSGQLGGTLAVGDLNHDGVVDLVVSDPNPIRPIGTTTGTGVVAVLYGGSGGLTTDRSVVLDRPSAGIPADAGPIGGQLVVGDFNGNGTAELALTVDDGKVQVLERTANGFTPSQPGPLTGPSLGVDDRMGPDEDGEGGGERVFGSVMAVGDVDADGDDDLAVGLVRAGQNQEGAVAVVKGSPNGLTSAGVQTWNQDSPGVDGKAGALNGFGDVLAMGRLDTGPTDDLAIGARGDEVGGVGRAGSVTVLLGSPTGLTTTGAGGTRFHQDVPGIAGKAEELDGFGMTLAISNVQSKSQGSLIIGVPRENIGKVSASGQFHQLSISAGGPTAAGSVTLHLDSAGVKGKPRQEAEFGRALG